MARALAFPLFLFLLFVVGTLHAQNRDLRAGRLLLDDNGADGNGPHTVLLTAPALSTNRTLLLPDADGTLLLAPTSGYPAGRLLFGGSDGAIASAATISVDSAAGTVGVAGLTGVVFLEADPAENLAIISSRSIVLNIDDDDDGTGSSFAVETNGSSTDLLTVTETGLTTVRSSSNSGALRVASTASSSTAEILELRDGSTPRMVVRRNGDVGLGDATPEARLDVESDDGSDPAVIITHNDPDGIALEIADGSLRLSHGIGTDATIPGDVILWTVADNGLAGTGLTVALPGGEDGAILYVYYADADPGMVGAHATTPGERLTFIHVAGAWRLF